MMIATWLLGLGCTDGDAAVKEAATQVVMEAFQSVDRSGPVGVEALGKGVWWRAAALDPDCLRGKELAFRDPSPGKGPRFSPTYDAQSVFQAGTEAGFCVHVGDSLSMTPNKVSQYDGAWVVDVEFGIGSPNAWWECLDPVQKTRPIRLATADDGTLSIEKMPALLGDGCPTPLKLVNPKREGRKVPTTRPPSAPSLQDVVLAAKRVDDAMWAGDLQAVYDATACYNLYEKQKFGSCSGAELVNAGPIPRGQLRRQDGPPWTNNRFTLDDIGRPKADKSDPTLFHSVVVSGTLKRKKRTISVQWVDNAFKLVGLVQRKAEGLTTVEYVTDLGRSDARDIFRRRMEGEDIDHQGRPPLKDEDVF